MKAYLFTWNPIKTPFEELPKLVNDIRDHGQIVIPWSTNSYRHVVGDLAFLMRQGKPPRGIFGSGKIVSPPFRDLHWKEEKRSLGIMSLYVKLSIEILLHPQQEILLSRDILKFDARFSKMNWDSQGSGVQIPVDVANELNKFMNDFKRYDR